MLSEWVKSKAEVDKIVRMCETGRAMRGVTRPTNTNCFDKATINRKHLETFNLKIQKVK